MTEQPAALDGIRVLDLSRVLAGPFCGALLADMGADVLKIEDTGSGDESRAWQPQVQRQSPAYIVNNRNKRGLSIDLRSAGGAAVLRRLVGTADVLVENFRTGTMESFGLGHEALAAINPRLVYCAISAFGREGPRAAEGGYEALMQAFSGVMSITGEADGAPVRAGTSSIDLATGALCAFGIVTALHQRTRSGVGQRVDGSLLATALGLLNFQAGNHLLAGQTPRALGSAHPSIAPYRNYRCADGAWIFVAGANDRLAQRLMTALELSWVNDDPRFASNAERVRHRDALDRIVAEAVSQRPRAELLQALQAAGFPAAPVNTVPQALADPQVQQTGLLWTLHQPGLGDVPVVGMPLRMSATQPALRRHAPALGEHTREVLAECGYTAAEIDALQHDGSVR